MNPARNWQESSATFKNDRMRVLVQLLDRAGQLCEANGQSANPAQHFSYGGLSL